MAFVRAGFASAGHETNPTMPTVDGTRYIVKTQNPTSFAKTRFHNISKIKVVAATNLCHLPKLNSIEPDQDFNKIEDLKTEHVVAGGSLDHDLLEQRHALRREHFRAPPRTRRDQVLPGTLDWSAYIYTYV